MKLFSLLIATVLSNPTVNHQQLDVDDDCLATCKRVLDLQYAKCVDKPEEEQTQCLTALAVAVGQCLKNQCQ